METYKRLLEMKQKREQVQGEKPRFAPPNDQELVAEAQERRRILGPPEINPTEVVKGSKLGTGSFGDVWKGSCREQPVAIKILHRQDFDAKQLQVFKREVEVLSQIYHPNVCLFMGACFEKGHMMIVSELVGKGDLEKLLRNANVELSLFLRIKMAIEAARGMVWLHYGEPVFIHRDVKPANFLVTENWHIKITDFGLSQASSQGMSLRDGKEGARGTPLWMAPEVLEGKEFSTSADVYSFGIVLWEIYCRKEPFNQFRNYQKFKEAVCKQKTRPRIPEECPRSLQTLIERCWHADPLLRPDFVSILEELEAILIDVAIAEGDASANAFWRRHHKGREEVAWEEFSKTFLEHLEVKSPNSNNNNKSEEMGKLCEIPTQDQIRNASKEMLQEFSERSPSNYQIVYQEFVRRANHPQDAIAIGSSSGGGGGGEAMDLGEDDAADAEFEAREAERVFNLNVKCLNAIFVKEGNIVSLEHFGNVLNWFGPIDDPTASEPFMDRTRNLLAKSWFHGSIQTDESERLLKGRPDGTFLVRCSNKFPGTFTISKVQEEKTSHQRVSHKVGSGFVLNGKTFQSLEEVVEKSAEELKLITSCPGSKYAHLFLLDEHISGYVGM